MTTQLTNGLSSVSAMCRSPSNNSVFRTPSTNNIHPLDSPVAVPYSNLDKHNEELEHSWRDVVFSHWDIRNFDVCNLKGEKLCSIETEKVYGLFPRTTLSREDGHIAIYDWKGLFSSTWVLPSTTGVLCPRWRKHTREPTHWVASSRYVKDRVRDRIHKSSSKAIYHTFTTSHDNRKYVWQSTKNGSSLFHITPDGKRRSPLGACSLVASVQGPELITSGAFEGTKKRVLKHNEFYPLSLDYIMSTFLIVDSKRYRKFFSVKKDYDYCHPVDHLHDGSEKPHIAQWALPPMDTFEPPKNLRTICFADEVGEELEAGYPRQPLEESAMSLGPIAQEPATPPRSALKCKSQRPHHRPRRSRIRPTCPRMSESGDSESSFSGRSSSRQLRRVPNKPRRSRSQRRSREGFSPILYPTALTHDPSSAQEAVVRRWCQEYGLGVKQTKRSPGARGVIERLPLVGRDAIHFL